MPGLFGAALKVRTGTDLRDSSLRARLRQATQPAHARLEASLGVLEEPVPADRIMRLLQRFHGFHATWEPALEGKVPEQMLLPRLKLPLLQADLRSLGADDSLLRALPSCPSAPALCQDQASAAGALYVMEGSSLGGLVIDRVLARAPWYPAGGLHYWHPYGRDTGKRWKETLDYLEALPACWSDEVIESANATFDLLQSWLPPHRHFEEPLPRLYPGLAGRLTG